MRMFEQRTVPDRIERLRSRVETLGARDTSARPVLDIIKGVLDLLNDELGNAQDQDPV